MAITKKELIQFIKENCYMSYDGKVDWMWKEDVGSRAPEEINNKIGKFVFSEQGEGGSE